MPLLLLALLILPLAIVLIGRLLHKWSMVGGWCKLTNRLDGKLVVITGSNTGLGLETASQLALRGATVIMACRDMDKAGRAREQLLTTYGSKSAYWTTEADDLKSIQTPIQSEQLICESLDLASAKSINAFASRLASTHLEQRSGGLDILINNAGVYLYAQPIAGDLELNMAINHLGPFLLTNLLLPHLTTASGRIVNVSSDSHGVGWFGGDKLCALPFYSTAYGASKLANIVHALELSRRHKSELVAVSLHPGLVTTDVFRHEGWVNSFIKLLCRLGGKTALEGAQTLIYCALAPNLVNGGYYVNCQPCQAVARAYDERVGEFLWQQSEQLIASLPL